MADLLLLPHTAPFVTALLVCLFMLILALIGLGGDSDGGPEIETAGALDTDIDVTGTDGLPAEIAADLDASLAAATDGEIDADAASGTQVGALGAMMNFLNPGGVPMSVLVALFACGYGVSGLAVQKILDVTLGAPLSATLAGLALAPAGVLSTRIFGGLPGRLIPSVQTAAIKATGLKGASAEITVGRAELGRPARARIADRHTGGQILNVDVVPYRDGDSFPQGTEVVLLQQTKGGTWIAGRLPQD